MPNQDVNPSTSNDETKALTKQIKQISLQLTTSEEQRKQLERELLTMKPINDPETDDEDQGRAISTTYEDIDTAVRSADEIQLDSYKVLPIFSGNKNEYRSWRDQVVKRMNLIDQYTAHPKYEAALAIIRAKITGAASNVLLNNRATYNIDHIIKILDLTYADQRPIYAVEAEMTSIKQADKTLQQYYNSINFALNSLITKIMLTYGLEAEQRSLILEGRKKAVRTFIVGLKSRMAKQILYGQQPKSLIDAYSIAQTLLYDNEQLQLEQWSMPQRNQPRQ